MANLDSDRTTQSVWRVRRASCSHSEGVAQVNHGTVENMKTAGDLVAAGLTIGVVAALLPPLAAIFTIIWTAIRIWETRTVRQLVRWWFK